MESDKEAAISLKLRDLRDEMERTVRQMNEDLNHERTQSQNYHKQIFALREVSMNLASCEITATVLLSYLYPNSHTLGT